MGNFLVYRNDDLPLFYFMHASIEKAFGLVMVSLYMRPNLSVTLISMVVSGAEALVLNRCRVLTDGKDSDLFIFARVTLYAIT